MFTMVTGKKGAGKTYYAVSLIVEELLHSSRRIVTNLPLKLPGLHAYLIEKGKQVDLERRIVRIEGVELKDFWLRRAPGVKVTIDDDGMVLSDPEPVLYVLDELHTYFNSHRWQKIGDQVTYYLGQQRKVGDDIIGITQVGGNIAKQFRSLVDEWLVIRNYGNEVWAGIRLPQKCERQVYLSEPGLTTTCSDASVFSVDPKGIGSCYDTNKGVGVSGRGEVFKRKRGFHWSLGLGILVVVLGVVICVPGMLGKFLMKKGLIDTAKLVGNQTNVVSGSGAAHVVASTGAVGSVIPVGDSNMVEKALVMLVSKLVDEAKLSKVFVNGLWSSGARCRVVLSDGRVLTEKTVVSADREGVNLVNGERIEYRFGADMEVKPVSRSEAHSWLGAQASY